MLLALVMVLGMLPVGAFAAEEEASEPIAADCSEGHSWSLWEPTEDETAEQRICGVCGETETYVYEVVETIEEVVSEPAAMAADENPNLNTEVDAVVWMDKDKEDMLEYAITYQKLDDIIRAALGDTSNAKVTYDDINVGSILDMQKHEDRISELGDKIANHEIIPAKVGNRDVKIAFRNVTTFGISIADTVISAAGEAPADLEAQIAAWLAQANNFDVLQNGYMTVATAGADVEVKNISKAWPAAGEEDVLAAEIAVTIADDVYPYTVKNGESDFEPTVHTVTVTLYLHQQNKVITFMNGDAVYEILDAAENQATPVPAVDPTRDYYNFVGWSQDQIVTGNATYVASWAPQIDVNNNGIADQEESFTVIYVDGLGNELLNETVAWGSNTPAVANPTREYYTFAGWDKAIAAQVTENVVYTATWDAITDGNGDNIADEEQSFTVTYLNKDGSIWEEQTVPYGTATPKPALNPVDPTGRYIFKAWIDVAATVTKDATYEASWTPRIDTNNNGIADQEESFTVIFDGNGGVTADGKTEVVYENVPYGEFVDVPQFIKDGYKNSWAPNIYSWQTEVYVDKDITYTAQWVMENAPDVYLLIDDEQIPVVPVEVAPGVFKAKEYTKAELTKLGMDFGEGLQWDGYWYVAEYDNEINDFVISTEPYDFSQDLEPGTLWLYANFWYDVDGNGKEDGTAADPFYQYVFTVGNTLVPYENYLEADAFDPYAQPYPTNNKDGLAFTGWKLKSEATDVDQNGNIIERLYWFEPTFADDRNNNEIADGSAEDPFEWYIYLNEKGEELLNEQWLAGDAIPSYTSAHPYFWKWDYNKTTNEAGEVVHIYKTLLDENGNGVDDAAEIDTLVVYLNGEAIGVSIQGGKATLPGVGTITINGLMSNGKFSYTDATHIIAEPAEGIYVAAITVDAKELPLFYQNKKASNKTFGPQVRSMAAPIDEAKAVTIGVQFVDEGFEAIDNAQLKLTDLRDNAADLESYLYDKIIASPAYDFLGADNISMTYVARESTTSATINLDKLISRLSTELDSALADMARDKLGGSSVTMDISGEKILSIDETVTYKSAQIVADEYFDNVDISHLTPENMEEEFAPILADLISALKKNAEIRPLNYVSGNSQLKQITVSAAANDKTGAMSADVFVKLVNDLKSANLVVPTAAVVREYGSYTDADLLAMVSSDEGAPAFYMDGTYEAKAPGTYTVKIISPQEGDYRETVATFQLIVKKANVTLTIPSHVVDVDETYELSDILATINHDKATLIQVIAGLNADVLFELPEDLSLGGDATIVLNELTVPTYIKMPQFYLDALKDMGVDLSKNHQISDIKKILEDNKNDADASEVMKTLCDTLLPVLDQAEGSIAEVVAQINGSAGGFAALGELKVLLNFDPNAKPGYGGEGIISGGVFLNFATLLNPDNFNITYESSGAKLKENAMAQSIFASMGVDTAYLKSCGALVINPFTVIHNNGIQLFYQNPENVQNLYVEPNDILNNTKKVLGVWHDNEGIITEKCEITYYGISTKGQISHGAVAPHDPGLYMVTAKYFDENNVKVGTDVALVIIDLTKASIEVERKTALFDEENPTKEHRPAIIIRDENGNVLNQVAGKTIISAGVDVDLTSGNIGLEDLTGVVNIDFPSGLDNLWETYAASLKPEDITITDVVKFLEELKVQIEEKIPENLPSILSAADSYVKMLKEASVAGCNRLITELSRIPVQAKLSFEDNKGFSAHGVYFYYGIITDEEVYPDGNAGLLIIKTAEDFYMFDTIVPYDGNQHMPEFDDETNRDEMIVVIDRQTNTVNFRVENDLASIIEAALAKAGFTLQDGSNAVLGNIYKKGQAKATDLTAEIMAKISAEATSRIEAQFPAGSEKLANALTKMSNRLVKLETQLSSHLQKVDRMPNDTLIVFNGDLPVELGTYEFFGFSYGLAATQATLEIVPTQIDIAVSGINTTVGEEPTIEFTVTINGEEATAEQIAALNITFLVNNGEITLAEAVQNPGEYTITPVTSYSGDKHYIVNITSGTLVVEEDEEVLGTIGKGTWRMDLDSVVYLDYYPVFTGFADDFDYANRAGAIIWTSKTAPTHRDQLIWDFENPENNANLYDAKGMKQDDKGWYIESLEIYAKNLGDMVYIRPYVIAEDGTYVYYNGAPYYSPAYFCYDLLCDMGEAENTRAVCAALIEYGASAQDYFDYNEGKFVNNIPDGPNKDNPKKWSNIDLSIYDLVCKDSYLDEVVVDAHVRSLAATLTGTRAGITYVDPTLDLKGAIRLSVGYNIDSSVIDLENVAKAEVLFWTASEMAQLDTLAYDSLSADTYSCALTKATGNEEVYIGDYLAESNYILAKNLSESVYYSCRITMNDGTVYRSGLGYYSPEQFVLDHLKQVDGTLIETVCERIAVYGEMARIRFAK